MPPMFPSDSVIRRVNIEPAILFGAGRALLLQLAHPAVAQGVEDHSEFQRQPFRRLQGTLEATYAVVFGTEELAQGVGRRLRWIHDFITGPAYRANDPANLLWVHATLVDTALGCYTDLVGPLSTEDAETYYQEMTVVAEVFGVPRDQQPANLADFRRYFDDTVNEFEITAAGRDLIAFILDPTLPRQLHVPLGPVLSRQTRFTLGRTPTPIREQLGQPWTEDDQAWLGRAEHRIRRVMAATPRSVRTALPRLNGFYLLWLAQKHVAEFDARRSRGAVSTPA